MATLIWSKVVLLSHQVYPLSYLILYLKGKIHAAREEWELAKTCYQVLFLTPSPLLNCVPRTRCLSTRATWPVCRNSASSTSASAGAHPNLTAA